MGMCVVENLSRVFLPKWWVMRVYIVWVKGKKVRLKNLLGSMFCEYFVGRTYLLNTREIDCLTWLFSFQHMLLICPFHGLLFLRTSRELVAKLHWFFISCSILHQLNTKPNTVKFHKIQIAKLKQIQHFLSWNKVKIKHSCKS